MASVNRYILNYLDSPIKILFWTKGELVLFLGPFFVGVFIDEFVCGLMVSCLNAFTVRQYKKRFGKGQLQAVLYWYLPPVKKLKALPPSFIREYL